MGTNKTQTPDQVSLKGTTSSHCHPELRRSLCLICFDGINSRSIHHNPCGGKCTYKTMVSTQYTSNIYADEQHRIFHSSIHHLASSCIPSIDPLSPHEISDSASLVDTEWRNLRDSTMLESMLSSKGQFASSKLSINRDTWVAHKSAVMLYKEERFWLTTKGKMKYWALRIRVSKGKISNNNNILG